jgi:hypothetical protein
MTLNTQSLFQTLQLDLTQLDEERIKARNTMLIRTLIHLPPTFFVAGLCIWIFSKDSPYLGFATGFATIILFSWWITRINAIKNIFAKSFKEKVIQRMIRKIDAGFTYQPDTKLHYPEDDNPLVKQINKSKILPAYNKCWIEDIISGTVRENKFDFMELKMENGTGRQRRTVFQGILLTTRHKAPFPTNIYIYPNNGNQLFSGLLSIFNVRKPPGKEIKLAHPEFERLFKVFADDDKTPMEVLNGTVLERLLKIHQKITGTNGMRDSISFSFVQDTITIAVKLKTNLFEPQIARPVNDIGYFESNASYLVLFLGLIDDLNVSR